MVSGRTLVGTSASMEEREHEEQPEAPDLGASVQAETSETDVGPPGGDPLDAGYIPPDRPYGLDDDVTPAAMHEPETVDSRLARERPDVTDESYEPAASDAGQLAGDERSGRLAPAEDTAIEGTAADASTGSTDARDTGLGGGAAAAEEAAMHDLDEGPPLTDDEGRSGPTDPEGRSSDPDPGP
ncbi:MAG: hypothetical protein GEV09_18395 [Pseudonocardiaceae bacterium]|nr:hypothetical protein [Pseudonocardiaceae bacterium]